jgi:penicillin-binding protein 1A
VLFRRRREAPRRPRRRVRKLRLLLLLTILGIVCSVTFTLGLVTAIADDVPTLDPFNTQREERNGYIYAGDGKTVLAVLRGDESRVLVDSSEIAPIMKQATVAVEDRRFWEHRGVDLRGIIRAVWADIRNREFVQGASTITQQLVRSTYIQPDRTISRKLKEAALAWQLERKWSKDRILTAYLNTIYFGNNAYGIEMAARVYFQKKAAELTLPEAALLAGMLRNPAAYDPISNPTRALERRNYVLALMLGQDLITKDQYDTARTAPLPSADEVRLPGTRGPAQYFTEYVKQQLVEYYGSGKVFGGGLKVYTSIDLGLQKLAREAIDKWLTRPDGPAAALVAVDPRDGRILAMIGGEGFSKSQFNLATQGERQPGSSFKPFVLAAALAKGISPQTTFQSRPQVVNLGDKLWAVRNYENAYLGTVDLETATIVSDNTVYAQLTALVGPQNVATMARKLGIGSPLEGFVGIGLGNEAVNPLEMARAYASFANGGARVDGSLLGDRPRAILAVDDGRHQDFNEPVKRQILSEDSTAILNSVLTDVVVEGTGRRAGLDDRPTAGKTGTTENYGDAWFVGYTPQLAVAIWVGYPDRLQPMMHEFSGDPVAGGTYPALIYRAFAKRALDYLGEPPEYFTPRPYPYAATFRVAERDGRVLLDNGACGDARSVVYFVGFEPKKSANCGTNEVEVPSVMGASELDAQARLADSSLLAEIIERPARPGERPGIVLEQTPAKGTLQTSQTVRLIIARATSGLIPKVVGLPLTEAQLELADDELQAEIEAYVEGNPGVVVSQAPQAGTAAGPAQIVRLVVGK